MPPSRCGASVVSVSLSTSYRMILNLAHLAGGQYYSGEVTCESDAVCKYSDQWYRSVWFFCQRLYDFRSKPFFCSQCVPISWVTTTTTSKTSSSITTTSGGSTSTGFVKVSGQRFTLNGSKYALVGHNAYWLAQLGSTTDINAAFADIAKTGATTVRTWFVD